MHLIIYGPEGSGKGTQANLLSKYYHLPILTSGDLVRAKAKADKGSIGEACRRALQSGTYVSDEVMFEIWRQKLATQEAKKGFILDGFPRNKHQAEFLLDQVKKNGYKIDRVIYITLGDEEAHRRLIKRNRKLFEGSTEFHDSPERIAQRLATYRAREKETLTYFKEMKLLSEINGEQAVEEVFHEIVSG